MPLFSVTDFQSQAHFEQKPVRDTVDYPSSAISASSTAPVASDENNHQPPPGSIPTPVLIASRLAEHKGAGSPSTHPNILIQRTRSLEAQHSSSPKCAPPTHAKPARLPDNISMRSSCNPSPQSIAAAAVSLQERRSQMLANLPSNAHPLEGGEPTCIRNMPTRSVLTGSRSSIFSPIKDEGQSLMNSHEAKPSHPDQVSQPIVRAKPATVPSSPAPRPPRLTPSPSIQKPPMPPEVLSMVGPKPCLRAQGVTVQFSGKGTTEEDRRDALRKLGLLSKTS
uniref:Proline and serine rich 2 n=1 Tax=Electrophorus electricus TaxID=8005 RepID=A0A4W4DWZ1_ELEEL